MLPDIDLDFTDKFNPDEVFPESIQASIVRDGKLIKHTVGRYFQKIAKDGVTGLAAIPYKEAEALEYFKVDFLHIDAIDHIQSKQELRQLINKEPDWNILNDEKLVQKLFHIHGHYSLLQRLKPQSVDDLADAMSLIRPGKKHLLDDYIKNKSQTRVLLYTKTDGYYLKRSHAIAYALTIVAQMHLISQGRL
jgi:DNA polymerase III alpha subunit